MLFRASFPPRRTIVTIVLAALLAASLVANVVLLRLASRPLYAEGERPLIERTVALAAGGSPARAEELRASTVPIVVEAGGGRCVELRRRDGRGYGGACYDAGGRLTRESAGVTN